MKKSLVSRGISRSRKVVGRWALAGGPVRRGLYYRYISEAFGREERAVDAGITAYHGTLGTGKELFTLRRNVHMLEKGLTMRPRRDEFALGYIGSTVQAFAGVHRLGAASGVGVDESRWMHTVLTEYFEATSRSTNPKIERLRATFRDLEPIEPTRVSIASGPHLPQGLPPAVSIEKLTELAMNRRSVRWFTGQPVDRTLVDAAMAVAAESPTACNRQPYRFEVFDDPESVRRVAAIPMGTAGYAEQLSGIIVIVGDLSAFFDERDRHLIYVDSCLAAMGLIYGLEAQGVASCCINWPDLPDRDKAIAALLGLPSHERVVMLLAYGYPDPSGLVPYSAKRPVEAVRRYRSLTRPAD
ncbi:nitroreductase family protein [Herbiconiux sp. CPCC 205716]|uniref:Nitroreductase family protein n=1 Tax=Herbiconiux gentiana TaxID=2970912 RepID=A0ABT2GBY8_9MICO|nr:nitroreductase family protein [Herbiconiux gentiana]MCS5713725.1 nitroreductase family protein [Herbiconiux gentiana]